MKLFKIKNYLDARVPLAFQEEYDNCGLLIGDENLEIKSVLISIDCTEEVINEAINDNHNLIISHHPLIFKGVKKITKSNYVEKIIQKAIKNDIAIYAMHTNLDNIYGGVSFRIAEKIQLENTRFLKPKTNLLSKLTVYCPSSHTKKVKEALFLHGAGGIGNLYDKCSFTSQGIGTFRALKGSDPFLGQIGKDEIVKEDRIEVVFYSYLRHKIITALLNVHPYQEVAYVCEEMQNESNIGSGVIGDLNNEMSLNNFLKHVKKQMNCNVIRYTNSSMKKTVKKIAVCGGSGSLLLKDAISKQADVYISSDFKYHDFFDANNSIYIFDIGHYESEFFTQQLIFDILTENFSKLAVQLTKVCTNPILYY